jgi:hypothetical protein
MSFSIFGLFDHRCATIAGTEHMLDNGHCMFASNGACLVTPFQHQFRVSPEQQSEAASGESPDKVPDVPYLTSLRELVQR